MNVKTSSLLITIFGVGTILGGIIGGKLSDKYSERTVSIYFLCMQALTFFLLTLFETHKLLMIDLFFMGIATYGFMAANNLWLLKECLNKDILAKYINLARVGSNLGMAIAGVIIAEWINVGFARIFLTVAIILFLCVLYLLVFVRKLNKSQILEKKDESIGVSVSHPQVIVIMLVCLFLAGLLIAQLGSTYPVYVEKNFGIQAVSLLFILDTVLIVLFQAPFVNIFKSWNKISLVGFGIFLMGLSLLILARASTLTVLIFSGIIFTIGEMLFVAMVQIVYYENLCEKNKGSFMGLFHAVAACARVLGPIGGGIIYQAYHPETLWYVSSLIGVFCLLQCLLFRSSNLKKAMLKIPLRLQ
jgi:predicted MFS family arabinose efflux permease